MGANEAEEGDENEGRLHRPVTGGQRETSAISTWKGPKGSLRSERYAVATQKGVLSFWQGKNFKDLRPEAINRCYNTHTIFVCIKHCACYLYACLEPLYSPKLHERR